MGLIGPFLPYIIGAVLVAGVLGGTYYKGREAGKEVERAEWAPKLTACKEQVSGLENAVATQNRAVEALKAEGDARVKRAADGLKRAQDGARATQAESARLRGLAGKPSAGACPAADAVKAVRDGLR